MPYIVFIAHSHSYRNTPGLELAPQDAKKDMTQIDAHTYSSREAVYEEIDPNSSIKLKTDYDYTRNEAYLTTVREGGVAASGDVGNPPEGVQVDVPEDGAQ